MSVRKKTTRKVDELRQISSESHSPSPAAAAASLDEDGALTTCIVPNCRNHTVNNAEHIFPFPDPVKEFALRKQWLKSINEKCGDEYPALTGVALLKQPNAGVCNQHFAKDDFVSGWMTYPGKGVKYEIKSSAVPSIFCKTFW